MDLHVPFQAGALPSLQEVKIHGLNASGLTRETADATAAGLRGAMPDRIAGMLEVGGWDESEEEGGCFRVTDSGAADEEVDCKHVLVALEPWRDVWGKVEDLGFEGLAFKAGDMRGMLQLFSGVQEINLRGVDLAVSTLKEAILVPTLRSLSAYDLQHKDVNDGLLDAMLAAQSDSARQDVLHVDVNVWFLKDSYTHAPNRAEFAAVFKVVDAWKRASRGFDPVRVKFELDYHATH